MRYLIYIILFTSPMLFLEAAAAAPLQMKAKFQEAKQGDFIVTEQDKNYSLLFIRDLTADTLTLEEITIPEGQIDPKTIHWQEWLTSKAPGHTSWTLYEIDLKTGKLLESFSYSKRGWLFLDETQQFLAKLLTLPLEKLSTAERRKIGPQPAAGENDRRALWNPPLVLSGKKVNKPQFDVWKARWPNDATPLAGCTVELYFSLQNPTFPFPHWIEVQSPHYAFKLRAIDAGSDLRSPYYGPVPHRSPQFNGPAQKKKGGGLVLNITAPAYHRQIDLFAIDLTGESRMPIPIPNEGHRDPQTEAMQLTVTETELKRLLIPGHRYQWAISSEEGFTVESEEIFSWK